MLDTRYWILVAGPALLKNYAEVFASSFAKATPVRDTMRWAGQVATRIYATLRGGKKRLLTTLSLPIILP
jgi:hypothetical protein